MSGCMIAFLVVLGIFVVLAIVGGALAGTVMSSLHSARGKAEDARTQSILSQSRSTAEIYAADHSGTYGISEKDTFCTDAKSGFPALAGHSENAPQVTCTVSSKYPSKTYTVIAESSVTPGSYFCADQGKDGDMNAPSVVLIGALQGNTAYVPGVTCK